jgi:hypothetical protein
MLDKTYSPLIVPLKSCNWMCGQAPASLPHLLTLICWVTGNDPFWWWMLPCEPGGNRKWKCLSSSASPMWFYTWVPKLLLEWETNHQTACLLLKQNTRWLWGAFSPVNAETHHICTECQAGVSAFKEYISQRTSQCVRSHRTRWHTWWVRLSWRFRLRPEEE